MKKLLLLLLAAAGIAYVVYTDNLIAKFQEYITLKHMVHLTSSAFVDNGLIPSLYTCDGMAKNPPLDITDVPGIGQTMVLIVDDPDAPNRTFTHWVVFNIPASTTSIAEKSVPQQAVQGNNSAGSAEYIAPCPPTGTHRYLFTLYVLDNAVSLPEGASKADVEEAMKGHIIDKTQLIGRYAKVQ